MSRRRAGGPVAAVALVAFTVAACGGDPQARPTSTPYTPPPALGALGSPAPGARTPKPVKVPKPDLRSKDQADASGGEGGTQPWPTLASAGVPRGKKLVRSGPLRVRQDGAVIDGRLVDQEISVEADNVTIRNTEVVGEGEWGIIQREGFSGLRVERSEIHGNGRDKMQVGVLNYGGALTVRSTYIHTATDGINTPHGLIERNVIKDLKYFDGDHNDGIASPSGPSKGLSLVIRQNVILNRLGQTSAVALFQDFGRAHDITVEYNFLAGGGYSLYGGSGRYGQASGIRIVGNVFSRMLHKKGGYFGPVTAFDPSGPGNVWRGNVWAESGKPVEP